MKTIRDVIISTTEPSVNNVGWLKPLQNGTFMLLFFVKGKWTPTSQESVGELRFQHIQDIPDIVIKVQ